MSRPVEVPLYLEDLTKRAQLKLAAIYSHASGTTIQLHHIDWPSPIITMFFDLDSVMVSDNEGTPMNPPQWPQLKWRCVEQNCGALAVNMARQLCKWHDENRLSQPIKPMTTPEQPVTPCPLPRPIRRHRKDWLELLVTWAIVLTGLYLIAQGVRLIL